MTNPENITLAKTIARKINDEYANHKIDAEAYIDDYGRFNNFAMLITFNQKDNGLDLRKIVNIAKRITKEEKGTWRSHETPKIKYSCGYGQKTKEGYESSYIYVDLDINTVYHQQTNTFSEASEDVDENQLELF